MCVITGSTSRTGEPIARRLLNRGASVKVIGRAPARLKALVQLSANPVVADPLDSVSMRAAFLGGSAAWLMLQPNYIADSPDFRAYQQKLIDAMIPAVKAAEIRHVVVLSSWGADQESGVGPVAGLRDLEQAVNGLENTASLHLRAGYFMENSLQFIDDLLAGDIVRAAINPSVRIPWVATRDVSSSAALHLITRDFRGHEVLELHGQRDLSVVEILAVIARSLNRPQIRYQQITLDEACTKLIATGVAHNVAALTIELIDGINSGHLHTTQKRSVHTTTTTSIENFVIEHWLPQFVRRSARISV